MELNHRELERYVRRVSDRWPLDRALLGGARVADLRGAGPQRERGPEYVIVLVSEHFDGVPWLERVYVTGTLWDAYEMGAPGGRPRLHAGGVRAQARGHARRPRGRRMGARAAPGARLARILTVSGAAPNRA